MRSPLTLIVIILFAVAGCIGCNQPGKQKDSFITIDVTANSPKVELILQDIMDVEYIPLETNGDFVTQGLVLTVGNEIILVENRISDGDIFIFDRKTGKGLRKINRKGQGAEEYSYINEIVLDENKQEMFIINASEKKILVYDLYGNFRRSFSNTDDSFYSNVYNYDRDNLICYKEFPDLTNPSDNISACHFIISKQNGRVIQEIPIPIEKIKKPVARTGEATATMIPGAIHQIIPYHENWILTDTSSDTVYQFVSEANKLIPFVVRTPSIHTMEPPEAFLSPGVLTDRYFFMSIIKAEFDFTKGRGFPSSEIVYDKQEKSQFNVSVYNGDYLEKRGVNMTSRPLNDEIASWQILDAYRLVEYYKNDKLKGKLKEIAATLDEESNPVIMLVKHRKTNTP